MLVRCPVHTPVRTPMYGLPLGQSDQRIRCVFESVYNNYKYNPNVFYKPNDIRLMSAKDLYVQNITDSFQVKFPNVFTNYPLGAVRVEDQRFVDWDHYKFTLWQTQLNFAVFCASSACGVFVLGTVSVEHMNAKKSMIRSIYHFDSCLLSYQKNIKNTRNSNAT